MPGVRESEPKAVEQQYVLKLYISGATRRSQRAIDNLNRICEEFLSGHYDLEVVDLYQFPDLARREGILAAPTLVKKVPAPVRRLIGDLSQKDRVLLLLNLKKK